MNLPTRQWCLLRRLPSIFYIICSQYTDWRSVKKARSSLEFFNFSPKAFNWPSAVSSCIHHQKKQMTVAKTFFKGLFSPYLAFWTKTLGRACSTHWKICDKKNFRYDVTLDCKTVGFFLTISKEIDKARRESLTRAKRASRACEAREKKLTVRFPYDELVPNRGFKYVVELSKICSQLRPLGEFDTLGDWFRGRIAGVIICTWLRILTL